MRKFSEKLGSSFGFVKVRLCSLVLVIIGSTICLADDPKVEASQAAQQKVVKQTTTVKVKTAEEFLAAIDSNRTIILAPGEYKLTENGAKIPEVSDGAKVYKKSVYDGIEIVISEVTNLTIKGSEDEGQQTRLLVTPRYANVLTFVNSKNIQISNVVAGHTPSEGECNGAVFNFINSSNIELNNVDLFGSGTYGLTLTNVDYLTMSNSKIRGSGTYGLTLTNVDYLTMSNSKIRECTVGILKMDYSKHITLKANEFFDNSDTDFFEINGSRDVLIQNTGIRNNSIDFSYGCRYYLFKVDEFSQEIVVKDSTIKGNSICAFEKIVGKVKFVNTPLDDNVLLGEP